MKCCAPWVPLLAHRPHLHIHFRNPTCAMKSQVLTRVWHEDNVAVQPADDRADPLIRLDASGLNPGYVSSLRLPGAANTKMTWKIGSIFFHLGILSGHVVVIRLQWSTQLRLLFEVHAFALTPSEPHERHRQRRKGAAFACFEHSAWSNLFTLPLARTLAATVVAKVRSYRNAWLDFCMGQHVCKATNLQVFFTSTAVVFCISMWPEYTKAFTLQFSRRWSSWPQHYTTPEGSCYMKHFHCKRDLVISSSGGRNPPSRGRKFCTIVAFATFAWNFVVPTVFFVTLFVPRLGCES